ncbi:biotin--[acetyl-CoA-carboxylase] ligase [Chroococcidiopsis sp. TS-821]|uniref:biotin--[acetyl-CoA-carboxylase] ligase n=1 Tax=Chroococcidiopsis sp. TS-821 TaxID=1378066 RepID=UPI00211111DB|nr:biotin--[acetyl-CoA-carboxylase] ligase [Chroococcidiopsis sp. TS-821]
MESCPSTNTWAMQRDDLRHGEVAFTRQQTAGRGQHGRTWHAPPGVLTASFILDRLHSSQLPGLSLAAGLAAIYAVEDLLPDLSSKLWLKWSNDVLIEGRKLAGILCEAVSRGSYTRVIVGIGLNRCADFTQAGLEPDLVHSAVSLHQVSTSVPEELALLERLRHYLLEVSDICQRNGIAALIPQLRDRDFLYSRPVKIELAGEQFSGQAVGIDARGRLLVQLPTEVKALVSGRVVWWGDKTVSSVAD